MRNASALLIVAAIMVMAGAAARSLPPLRTLVYFPVGVAVVAAIGYSESRARPRMLFLVLCGLAVVGNAAVNNHLFASAAAAEFQDRLLAHDIVRVVQNAYPDLAKRYDPYQSGSRGFSGSARDPPSTCARNIRRLVLRMGWRPLRAGGGLLDAQRVEVDPVDSKGSQAQLRDPGKHARLATGRVDQALRGHARPEVRRLFASAASRSLHSWCRRACARRPWQPGLAQG